MTKFAIWHFWKGDVIQILDFNIWQNTQAESSALCLCPYLELWGEEIILSDQTGDKRNYRDPFIQCESEIPKLEIITARQQEANLDKSFKEPHFPSNSFQRLIVQIITGKSPTYLQKINPCVSSTHVLPLFSWLDDMP